MKKGLVLSKYATNPMYDRDEIYHLYLEKYFNLFMTMKVKGVDYQAENFIKRRLWSHGTIACFKLEGSEGVEDYPNGVPIFTDYAPSQYNIYDYPIYVNLINRRGVKFIPSRMMKVDKDVVIGFAQRNKRSVFSIVDIYLQKITEVEMTIRCNLKSHKSPVLYGFEQENEEKMRQYKNNFDSDDPNMMVNVDDISKIQVFQGNNNYVIDKLYSYKEALENELKEYLGINNLGLNEKKEHLITSEIDSNNEVVENSSDCFMDELNQFAENVKKVLGIEISFEWNKMDDVDDKDFEYEEEDKDE